MTLTNRLRSRRRFDNFRIDSSYAYAEKIDASTPRKSAKFGDEAAACVRNARKIRKKDKLELAFDSNFDPDCEVV